MATQPRAAGAIRGAHRFLDPASRLYDAMERWWEAPSTVRRIGTVLVTGFIVSLVVIELNRRGLLPAGISRAMTSSHLGAIYFAFTLLLFVEVAGLVFALPRSVADSVGKQFELLALILVRKCFLELAQVAEPISWATTRDHVPVIAADLGGSLLIFIAVGLYYRAQRHMPITTGPDDRAGFMAAKKLVALLLMVAFVALLARDAYRLAGGGGTESFFETFYTILIFSDILLVLLSLRYTSRFAVVFRNSGFAASTVLIRLALTAPPFVNAAMGLGAVVFALGLSLAYDRFAPAEPRKLAAGPRASPPE
jgi:hypothetical protein